jgi:serine/threonine protein kinase
MITRDRLVLFLAVCRAVQHAHRKGVIHRDLKPSNVLVMERDGAPIPKVIDFGIAKATDKWAVEKTLITHFGQIVGTPEYASPEQADTMTGDVDETSDVYSLGVLWYELLIGAVPFDTGEDRYQREPAHNETPERIFERRWALSVLDRVADRLRAEFVQHGRLDHFNRLKIFLLDQAEAPYAALAQEMGTSEGALKVAIHRLRKRYRELFRQEIAETVADAAEVESELRYLAAALTRR